ncbi:hypothetical protein [Nakamurella lactea]|uniref:hypothetical protein n=1 Tax=Nakamurella lactea TaxID=459515 RepID=UPI00040C1A98|nr:hypothetical protein [Nakamurella lactea]
MSAAGAGNAEAERLLLAAARNNAEWCAAVCRSHGLVTSFDENAWWSEDPAPQYYPDAITLHREAGPHDVLPNLRQRPGCSIKDSFGALDLREHGFVELFRADWIYRPATLPAPRMTRLRTENVRTPASLAEWARAWSDDETPADVFRPALLRNGDIRLLRVLDGDRVVGGAALNIAAGLVGISNVFAGPAAIDDVWQAVATAAADQFPGIDLVGYETDGDLPPAAAAGFATIGSLRVWLRQR